MCSTIKIGLPKYDDAVSVVGLPIILIILETFKCNQRHSIKKKRSRQACLPLNIMSFFFGCKKGTCSS